MVSRRQFPVRSVWKRDPGDAPGNLAMKMKTSVITCGFVYGCHTQDGCKDALNKNNQNSKNRTAAEEPPLTAAAHSHGITGKKSKYDEILPSHTHTRFIRSLKPGVRSSLLITVDNNTFMGCKTYPSVSKWTPKWTGQPVSLVYGHGQRKRCRCSHTNN